MCEATVANLTARPVMLQAMKEDLPPNTKCKDKFLIQSTIITPEKESMPLQDIVRRLLNLRLEFY